MCQKCNDTLLAGANAARLLAAAAKDLYSINESQAASTLAKAAADLFKDAPDEGKAATPGEAESDIERARRVLNESLPEGVIIGDDGVLYLNGNAVGVATLVRR